jgi:hypothetical protein
LSALRYTEITLCGRYKVEPYRCTIISNYSLPHVVAARTCSFDRERIDHSRDDIRQAQCSNQSLLQPLLFWGGHGEFLDKAEKLARTLEVLVIGALEKPFRLADVKLVLQGA